MGGSQSLEIPGGGSEGYHVLRVSVFYRPVRSIGVFLSPIRKIATLRQRKVQIEGGDVSAACSHRLNANAAK